MDVFRIVQELKVKNMKFIKKLLLVLLFALGIYATFSLKAYFDYKKFDYQECVRVESSKRLISHDPKIICNDTSSRLFWKVLFPFGIPRYPYAGLI